MFIRSALVSGILGALLAYLPLAIWQGFTMSLQVAPWYGLLIVRVIAIALFSLLNLVLVPFRVGLLSVEIIIFAFLLSFPIGIFHRLTLFPRSATKLWDDPRRYLYWLAALTMAGMFVVYELAFFRGEYNHSLLMFALDPQHGLAFLIATYATVGAINLSGLIGSRPSTLANARHVGPKPIDAFLKRLQRTFIRWRCDRLRRRATEILTEYDEIASWMQSRSADGTPSSMSEEDAVALVQIMSELSIGETRVELVQLRSSLSAPSKIDRQALAKAKARIKVVQRKVDQWKAVVDRALDY